MSGKNSYANKLRTEDIQTFEFEEFVGHGKKRGHDEVEEDIPNYPNEEEAQIRKNWLKWWYERMVTC